MRFGWLVAAAAMVCAGQAGAETITQGFSASYAEHGSTRPTHVGNIFIGPDKFIRSATIFYDASIGLTAPFLRYPSTADTGTISYTGSVGFYVYSLPVPIFVSNSFSGSQPCSDGVCNISFRLSGTLAIP